MAYVEDDQPPSTWELVAMVQPKNRKEIEKRCEKRSAFEYITHVDCDDKRFQEHIAIPGYN